MKKYFLSFGGPTSNYHQAVKRIATEAYRLHTFDRILIKTEKDLKADSAFWEKHGAFIEANPRGYGYWIWKQYLVLKTLEQMEDNDMLVYADAGCTLNKSGLDRLHEYFAMVQADEKGILTFDNYQTESSWTKMDIFVTLKSPVEHHHSLQTMGTTFIIRKCPASVNIIMECYEAMEYNLLNDSPSVAPNYPDFVENRHDQSIFSIITKKHGVLRLKSEVDEFLPQYPIHATRKVR